MSLPAVPGSLAAASSPPSSPVATIPRCGCWCDASRSPASSGSPSEWGDRAKPLVGDLTAPGLGLTDETVAELGAVDHVVHCGAVYDVTADDDAQRAANVDGTRAVIELAMRVDATLHHVSSIAVAGTFPGEYTEEDFDVAQELPTPYHQTKFEAEMLVRAAQGLRYARLPARRRRRRLPDRRDGQGGRPLLLLRHPGEAGRAAQVHADDAARHRPHQRRAGRLRRSTRSSRSCTCPAATVRRSISPPRSRSASSTSTAAWRARPGSRRCAPPCPGRWRHRS